ncbi:MAG: hypothetical protein OEZ65_01455 [Gemmatimonadota bacterium]|nr:hypothetical protein [Gemmatimonadota bacterium]MDH5758223.1 hypothetical protein [Gemmatimonadota bacterium]
MQLEKFRGRELHRVTKDVRKALGDDAMIIRTRSVQSPDGGYVEVLAAKPEAVESFKRRLDGGRAAAERARNRRRIGPYVVALVGPAGAGKTTSAVKLALHPRGLGSKKVGIISLDTFRVGAIEELQTYAEIANLPLEVVYHPQEVASAFQRMRDVDVIVVDTPGRGFTEDKGWRRILAAMEPDEVHLVLPAGLRRGVLRSMREKMEGLDVTHVLFSMLDEAGEAFELAEIAELVGLPARWVSDGHDVPADLAPAGHRILASLGIRADDGDEEDRQVARAG